jgi:DNA-binding SARP family transcriptional activator
MRKILVIIAGFAALFGGVAQARPVDNSASIESLARVSSRDGGVHAELAAAYLREGRIDDARTAYRRVLELDNVMLETRRGDTVWSHQVARQALAQSEAVTALR